LARASRAFVSHEATKQKEKKKDKKCACKNHPEVVGIEEINDGAEDD